MIEMIYFERFKDKDKYNSTKYLVTFECDKKDVYKLLELIDMKQAANAHSYIVKEDCSSAEISCTTYTEEYNDGYRIHTIS